MLDLIKKTILTGVGLAAMTKDKVEELAKELTEKGEMTEKEGRELVDELMKKSEQAKKDLETKVENIVEKVLGKMNLASKEDISKIEKRLKRLEKKEKADS
ncbi:MAG: polyhydroxyalkanoate synthesis regulator [Deltaproteobacteria bacterium]|nr:polyhydroxyalkanoate synthesis regulator [Deltaproteobacteria bacterium]